MTFTVTAPRVRPGRKRRWLRWVLVSAIAPCRVEPPEVPAGSGLSTVMLPGIACEVRRATPAGRR